MIPGFNRSITFPMSHRPKGRTAYHVRSASLPCGSHPLISNLEEQIRAVRSRAASVNPSLVWMEAGLSQIELLLLAVNEFLNLSETKTVLRRTAASIECLLEIFLYLVDSYGSLQSEIVTLKQHHYEVQSALRRHDSALLATSVKSQKKIEKELSHLASTLRASTKSSHLWLPSDDSAGEIVGVLIEAICATSAVTVVLLNRVVAVSAATSTAAASFSSSTIRPFKSRISSAEKEMLFHVKVEELEECVEMVERGSDRILRSLVNSRVSLLNIESGLF
ncbi:uncharacterized protein LOC144557022 [Carex rostrata]